MLDKLQRFKDIAKERNVEVCLPAPPVTADNIDRELIEDFVVEVQEVKSYLTIVEERNAKMEVLASKQVYEKKGDLDRLLEENRQTFDLIKHSLKDLSLDLKNSERTHPKEPETRVKQIVHNALSQKFREVLKASQVI